MAVASQLLSDAKAAEARLQELEWQAKNARIAFEQSVRRLYDDGASLREIAEALHLSHQRVHQLVGARSKHWWQFWRDGESHHSARVCSFCGEGPETHDLIAGPGVYICHRCIETADVCFADAASDVSTLTLLPEGSPKRCSFCGRRNTEHPIVTAGGHQICHACLGFAKQLAADHRP